jgi:cysteinyl-tRNA synthetase
VFRLYDTLTGQVQQIATPPRGVLRVFVGAPTPSRPAHVGDLRALLLADLIRRNAEHRHNQVVVATLVITDGGRDPAGGERDGGLNTGQVDSFSADSGTLNMRPAEQTAAASAVPDPVTSREIIVGSCRVETGPVLFEAREMAVPEAGEAANLVRLSDLPDRGLDPLALRLAYLSGRYREPADLSWDLLGDADQELRRWRQGVARWAESPSKPICAAVTAQVAAAFDDDLDTPAALRALRGLEQDPEIPPGSKFESFLHADQLLGLELPCQIGRAS